MRKRPKPFKRPGSKYLYFYTYKDGKRVRHSTRKTTIYEAEQEIDKYLKAQTDRPTFTLSEFAADFFKWNQCKWIERQHERDHGFSKAVADQRRAHLDRYILPKFGRFELSTIKAAEVDDWLLKLKQENGKKLTNQTKEHVLYSFRIVLREAERQELIDANPLDKVKPLGKKAKGRDVFTLEELAELFPRDPAKLLAIWKTWKHAAMFHLLASTGVRSGELRAWRWADLVEDEWLLVDKAVKKGGDIGPTKTDEARVVYVPKAARTALLNWKGKTPCGEPECFMFFGEDPRRPIAARNINAFFKKAVDERTEIEVAGRNLVVHSLRHTFNTLMRNHLPETLLRELTGHKSEAMTDRYDHPTAKDKIAKLKDSRKLLDGVFSV